MIAYFGTGLLGSGFVEAFLKRGEKVNVWNRSPEKAKALENAGATAFADPAAAAKGATRIHMTLADDASVDATLAAAASGISPGTEIVDHTTTDPEQTAARVQAWANRGITYAHAPVFMGPQAARDASGVMLACGPQAVFDRLKPELEKMTGKLVYLGEDPSRAATFKLMGNMMIFYVTTGIAEAYELGASHGVALSEAASLWEFFNPGATTGPRGKKVAEGSFDDATFELTMARKDIRLMLDAASAKGAPLTVMQAIAQKFDDAIAAGHGARDVTAIGHTAHTLAARKH